MYIVQLAISPISLMSPRYKSMARYMLAGAGLLLVPVHLLFAITADEQGERFLVRLWNTVR